MSGRKLVIFRAMREHGVEWFFRLIQEPIRLLRPNFIYGSQCLWNISLELLKVRKFT